ncbi:hypothetical protein D9611_008713 [Ephemerocybe angulata]|uniref:Phospholipase n=1 Tax=Ephemerocybe angulata TaxID=980116 RepID=A0A8H5FJF3_9AGAR|nr:hypothetical protein D9611_008713 [Tulosesus angulatus]
MSLVAVIHQARQAAQDATEPEPSEPTDQKEGYFTPKLSIPTPSQRAPDTPSTRTGPPRSLSFAYSLSQLPNHGTSSYHAYDTELLPLQSAAYYGDNDQEFLFSPHISAAAADTESGFRTPLEPPSLEKGPRDKGKKRESRAGTASTEKSNEDNGAWNPLLRWFHDTPVESPGGTRANSGEYFGPDAQEDSAPQSTSKGPTSIISRLFTQEPQRTGSRDEGEEPLEHEIVVRSPTIDESANEDGEATLDSPSILPKVPLSNRKGQEKQRGASHPHPTSPSTAAPTPATTAPNSPATRIRRAFSVPQQIQGSTSQQSTGGISTAGSSVHGGEESKEGEMKNPIGKAKWARLRALLPQITHEAGAQSSLNPPSAPGFAVSPAVNVVDELITGGLATLMPKLWFDRAEKGQRRIPVLLHRLRLRITDSLHPLHKSRSVFRIECEYANGAARWVVYRELRDFVSLHSHYTISQAVHGAGANLRLQGGEGRDRDKESHGAHHGHGREKLPDFPATSIPYFKFLNKESGSKIGKAEFARLQREQLENYLIGLIRVVMFHPTSNRLATFLEISSLSIALSHSGGAQYKAGYLRVEAVSNKTGSLVSSLFSSSQQEDKESRGATPFGRKSSSHSQRREQRWCAVRESYLVALVEPGELDIWDVFLLDSEFKIERPKRYYRQGFGGLLHLDGSSDEENEETVAPKSTSPTLHPHFADPKKAQKEHGIQIKVTDDDGKASLRSRVSKIFHRDGQSVKSSKSKSGGEMRKLDTETSSLGGQEDIGLGIIGGDEERKPGQKEGKQRRDGTVSSDKAGNGNLPSLDEAKDILQKRKSSSDSDVSTSLSRRSASPIQSDAESDHEDLPHKSLKSKLKLRSDSDSTLSAGARTPMLDPSVTMNGMLLGATAAQAKVDRLEANGDKSKEEEEEQRKALEEVRDHQRNLREQQKKAEGKDVSKHTFYIVNSQMRLKLYARNERQMLQFITAFERVAQNSPYTGKNRFDSFAPIRMNVAAQWLVDGRDYFWNLSRAILMAKESIYIHDWWLSPELLMRRPGKDHYRLDRLLERKAKEGVKIYIIIYLEVSNRTTPTDSSYTKQRLASLHPNVMVQRSPSHFQTGTFYWAHHEKLCVIDQTIAFMGGLDACFGRWDTPQHALTDDTLDTDQPEIWPGKDYSNPRVSDFHTLNKPEEDMYDRTKVPRMPWHDVAMQIVGQPARDLARHFVQRWNYLLRIKNHSRIMPFLLPPPEFRPGELSQMGLTGTCELQIVRSCGPWSMGTPGKVEHSIQNAYLKSIQMSEHFVYIENQFFITSTVVEEVKIENKIGDALVQRIIRAHHDKTPWKCCIVIPLLPGFTFGVDHSDASAIRIILECQNRTICRGPDSIFSRLRKEGIDPDEYISVYSLRNWAKMRDDVLVYIHAKICIVDDRLAIIGSANINERSQRGERDSELAAVIRDTDLIDCTMAGKPFKVGRFAHSLRVRLMREHLGIDVDALVEDDLMSRDPMKAEHDQQPWDPNSEQTKGKEGGFTEIGSQGNSAQAANLAHFVSAGAKQAVSGGAAAAAKYTGLGALRQPGPTAKASAEELETERRDYNAQGKQEEGFASSAVPTMEEKTVMEGRPRKENVATGYDVRISSDEPGEHSYHSSERSGDGAVYGAPANAGPDDGLPRLSVDLDNDQQRAGPEARSLLRKHMSFNQWGVPTSRPNIHPDDFEDPICDEFWKEKWVASAAHNTEIYRKVFHAVPDDLITTWKQYTEFVAYHDRMAKPPPQGDNTGRESQPSVSEEESNLGHEFQDGTSTEFSRDSHEPSVDANHGPSFDARQSRKPTKGTEPFERWEREEMERLLNDLNGHLVIYPTRFLEGEDIANNFLFNADRLLPLPIYT